MFLPHHDIQHISYKKDDFQKKEKKYEKIHSPSHFDIRKTQHASLVLLTVVLCKKINKFKTKKRCGTKTVNCLFMV